MSMAHFLFRVMRGYRLVLLLSMVMAVAQVLCDILTAFPLKLILDKVINQRDPDPPWSAAMGLFDQLATRLGLLPGDRPTEMTVIAFSATMIVILGLVSSVVSYVQLYAAATTGYSVVARLRRELFAHLLRLPLDWHGRRKSGDLVQRLTGNATDVEKLVIDGLVDLLAGLLVLVGMVAVMTLLNWRFTLLSLFVVPGLFVVVWSYTRRIKWSSRRAARASGQVADVATDDIRAVAEVKAFTLEEREAHHFARYVERYRESGLRAGRLDAQFRPVVAFVLALSTFTIVGVGSYVATGHTFQLWVLAIPGGTLTIGTLTVFLNYLNQLYQPMRNLSKLMFVASNAAASSERIQEVLDQETERMDGPVLLRPQYRLGGDIHYEGVVFGYQSEQAVLRGINLHVRAGERLALVGLSGSGKTTLVKLIPRFHEVWQGSIRIGGTDNRDIPLADLRRNISYVLPDTVLFEGTIRDNIAIGRREAKQQQIVHAAHQAQIHDTICALPDGYESHVREQGKNLSSGQRQRIAIARAILRDAPILLLDEPTASLDVEAEGEVMRALQRLVDGRTVIMITHRLSTLGHLDAIAVLHQGVLIEQGDFRTLKGANGMFSRLLEEQRWYSPEATLSGRPDGRPGVPLHEPARGKCLNPRVLPGVSSEWAELESPNLELPRPQRRSGRRPLTL